MKYQDRKKFSHSRIPHCEPIMPQNCTNRDCRLNKLKLSQKLNEISQRSKQEDGKTGQRRRIAGMRAAANGRSCFWNGYGCAGDLWREIERQTDISIINLAAIGIAIPVIDLLVPLANL